MSKKRVLIVEDDRDIREELTGLLREHDYCVIAAQDGLHALRLLRAGDPPDAILLDLMMPVMDGWEFREQQMKDPTLARIPVIVTTAGERSLDAQAYLRKPLDAQELLHVLRKHTGQA